MGIYLGQLPPAEIARLKAELAETLIANFCYPRFFDQRTDTLRTRPVDRAKRQEVWLYLSSFDFTAWNRVDLMSVDFQRYIEHLLIQFVQRNRSFFGSQGRRRMLDVRVMIGGSAVAVVQGLRGHLSGQKQGFGSPRPAMSWGMLPNGGRPEPGWEQVSAATMLLQQQLQEARGEVRSSDRLVTQQGNSSQVLARRGTRSQPLGSPDHGEVPYSPQAPSGAGRAAPPPSPYPTPTGVPPTPTATPVQAYTVRESRPFADQPSGPLPYVPPTDPAVQPTMEAEPVVMPRAGRAAAGQQQEARRPEASAAPAAETLRGTITPGKKAILNGGAAQAQAPIPPSNGAQERILASVGAGTSSVTPGQRELMAIGEDDVAIFEQMRHQMLVWLRVEAVRAGVDISGQGPAQLLDLLRQQARGEETRLQVVSTLLNLANQVIKTGLISVLDYKQALMFHLMHTRQ